MRVSEVGDDAAAFVLHRELLDPPVVARFTVPGEPMSKARARFTHYGGKPGAYTPEATKAAEQRMAWAFRQAAPGHVDDGATRYGVMALFFHGTRQRRDVDNMLKLVCDGLNGIAWRDDSQVDEVSARRGNDVPENARTEVLIYSLGKRLAPTRNCTRCGRPYPYYASQKVRTTCSAACTWADSRAARERNCERCGAAFTAEKSTSKQRFCSRDCGNAARRARAVR